MSFDQQIQVVIAVGTCLASVATFCAVVVALYLARRDESVRLNVRVDIMSRMKASSAVQHGCLLIRVTNLSMRPVMIVLIGWCIGKGKKKKYGVQVFGNPESTEIPARLEYGQTAQFTLSPAETVNWMKVMAGHILKDQSENSLKTLRVIIGTSTGKKDYEVVPGESVIEKCRVIVGEDELD